MADVHFISVWAACPSIPTRLRGVRAVRAKASARGWKKGSGLPGVTAGALRLTDRGEMRRVGEAYRTISRLDDRLIENTEEDGYDASQD